MSKLEVGNILTKPIEGAELIESPTDEAYLQECEKSNERMFQENKGFIALDLDVIYKS